MIAPSERISDGERSTIVTLPADTDVTRESVHLMNWELIPILENQMMDSLNHDVEKLLKTFGTSRNENYEILGTTDRHLARILPPTTMALSTRRDCPSWIFQGKDANVLFSVMETITRRDTNDHLARGCASSARGYVLLSNSCLKVRGCIPSRGN